MDAEAHHLSQPKRDWDPPRPLVCCTGDVSAGGGDGMDGRAGPSAGNKGTKRHRHEQRAADEYGGGDGRDGAHAQVRSCARDVQGAAGDGDGGVQCRAGCVFWPDRESGGL